MSEKITLRHVAELADVSVATVSLALNDREGVSAQTRERVFDAAIQLGYIEEKAPEPEQISIRLLSPYDINGNQDISESGFYGRVLAGVEQECRRKNISLVYSGVEIDAYQSLVRWSNMSIDRGIDGFLLVGSMIPPRIESELAALGKALLLLNSYGRTSRYDAVYIDNFAGAYAAVSHLIENGHTRIGIVGSNERHLCHQSIFERRQGYFAALADHGIQQSYAVDGLFNRVHVKQDTVQLLRKNPQITAIFACNDNMAVGVVEAARQLNLTIPDDLSIVGFDDDPNYSTIIIPHLTTIRVDQPLLGALGVQMLLDRIAQPDQTPVYTTVTTSLIKRDSVKKIG